MKKNFMAIASLLIAAMLLVVSCAPEVNVEGKVEDGLVEAVIGLGRSAKDIDISNGDKNALIKYEYKMTAAWKSTDTKAPIYGEVSSFTKLPTTKNDTGYGISERVPNVTLGSVTPGLWNIEVNGYCNDKLVLQGKASAYFNGSGTAATVFVAPVSDKGNVSVTITLQMQDLENSQTANYDRIKYAFTNLAGNSSIVEEVETNHVMTATSPSGNVNTYTANVTVKSGFNTVTFSLPGYENGKGGITKTFLAIPGVDVTITGSVTPAEFVAGTADIKVLSIDGGKVTVAAKTGTGSANVVDEDVTVKPAEGNTPAVIVTVKKLANGGTYTFTYDASSADDIIHTTVGLAEGEITRSYQWYVGEKKITNETESTFDFTETVAGDYNVTCVATVSFTKDGQDYKLQTSATLANVRVLEALPQSEPTTEPEESESPAEGQ